MLTIVNGKKWSSPVKFNAVYLVYLFIILSGFNLERFFPGVTLPVLGGNVGINGMQAVAFLMAGVLAGILAMAKPWDYSVESFQIIWIYALFIAFALFSFLFTDAKFFGGMNVIQYVVPLMLFVITLRQVRTPEDSRKLIYCFWLTLGLTVALTVFTLPFFDYSGGEVPGYGNTWGPRPFAIFLLPLWGLALARAYFRGGKNYLLLLGILLLAGVTLSRTVIFSMVVSTYFLSWRKSSAWKLGLTAILVLIGYSLLMIKPIQSRFFFSGMGSISDIFRLNFNTSGRGVFWSAIFPQVLNSPFLGHGVGSVMMLMKQSYGTIVHPHNDYLRLLYDFGFLGFFLFIAFWIKAGRFTYRVAKSNGYSTQTRTVAMASLINICLLGIVAITDNPIVYLQFYFGNVLILLALAYAMAGKEKTAASLFQTGAGLEKDKKLVVLTNIIPPYRKPMLTNLAREFDVTVLLSALSEPNRNWERGVDSLNYKQKVSRGVSITQNNKRTGFIHSLFLHFPYGTILDLVRLRPHTILTGEFGFRTLIAVLYRNLFACRLVIWVEGSDKFGIKPGLVRNVVRKFILRNADGVCAFGEHVVNYISEIGYPADRIWFCPQVVDNEHFFPKIETEERARKRRSLGLKGTVLLYVGHFSAQKGILNFIQNLVESECSQAFTLLLIGTGELESEIKDIASSCKDVNIVVLPFTQYDELPQYYWISDILVMPSLDDVWGMVVNEAMAAQLPIACSKFAGVSELIKPGVNGYVFDPLSPQETQELLESLARDSGRLNDMGLEAYNSIKSHSYENLNKILKTALSAQDGEIVIPEYTEVKRSINF